MKNKQLARHEFGIQPDSCSLNLPLLVSSCNKPYSHLVPSRSSSHSRISKDTGASPLEYRKSSQ